MDGIPAWFLRLAAPVLAAPIADLFNMSLAASYYVPWQCMEDGSLHPIPKILSPSRPSDFRPISVSPILALCRILERIVVCQYIYPSLFCPTYKQYLTSLHFDHVFTAALISILQQQQQQSYLPWEKYPYDNFHALNKYVKGLRYGLIGILLSSRNTPILTYLTLSITGLSVSFESTLTVLYLRISCQIPSTSRPA